VNLIPSNIILDAVVVMLSIVLHSTIVNAQANAVGPVLTLARAEELALQNHPRITAAGLRAKAAGRVVAEQRSAYYPNLAGNLTGAMAADTGTAVAAGNLTTSSLSSRLAGGGNLLQLITDFGRTSARVQSAQFEEKAEDQNTRDTRAQVVLAVRQAYYTVLSSEAALEAVREALKNRQLTLRQVTLLAQSLLKSTLDVSFAQVLESEAELAVVRAEDTVHESRAQLGAAIGEESDIVATLADQSQLPPLYPSVDQLIKEAEARRPDIQASQMRLQAAQRNAEAEKRLSYPTINFLGTAGALPEHDHTLKDNYASVGLNINVPIFTGGLLAARRSEAFLRAQASQEDLKYLQIEVAREVRFAWFEANDAFRRVGLTSQLVRQANEAMRLAQARYDNGLSGIVELNQAQLNQTSAEISAATTKYEYLSRRTSLDYQLGLFP
jgi:outer membrane protein